MLARSLHILESDEGQHQETAGRVLPKPSLAVDQHAPKSQGTIVINKAKQKRMASVLVELIGHSRPP